MISDTAKTTKVMPRKAGTIIRLDHEGFGFIRDDAGMDYFFHSNDLPRGTNFATLPLKTPVEFTPIDRTSARVETGRKNLRDKAVRIVFLQQQEIASAA